MLKIGHRGAAGHALENTIKSFEKALELGVDAIEFDVRRGPGWICVFHDPTLKRLSNGVDIRPISESPEIFWDSRVLGELIPTLVEVLEKFGKRTTLNIELKEEGIAEQVLKLIRRHDLMDSVIISAFDDSDNEPGDSSNWPELLLMKRQEPRLKIALLVEKEANLYRARSLADAYPVHAIVVPQAFTNNPRVFNGEDGLHWLKRNDLKVFVYTVNDVEGMKTLKEMGVDGIFSDYPDRFKEAGIE